MPPMPLCFSPFLVQIAILILSLSIHPNEAKKTTISSRIAQQNLEDASGVIIPGASDSSSSFEDQEVAPAGCAGTLIGCFGTHRALNSILPVIICIMIGAGEFSAFSLNASVLLRYIN
jgi:hypothetical protein